MEAAAFALACRLFGSINMVQGRANKWRGGVSGLLMTSEDLHSDFANEILQDSISHWECHVSIKWGGRGVFKIIHHDYHFYLVSKVYNSSYNVFYFFLLVQHWVSSNSYLLHSKNFAIYLSDDRIISASTCWFYILAAFISFKSVVSTVRLFFLFYFSQLLVPVQALVSKQYSY